MKFSLQFLGSLSRTKRSIERPFPYLFVLSRFYCLMDSVSELLSRAKERRRLSRQETEYLLSLPEDSSDVRLLIDTASSFIREANHDTASICAQIGAIIGPCYADCGFCSFASSFTDIEDFTIDSSLLGRYLDFFVKSGLVSCVSLMTIHGTDIDEILPLARQARSILPDSVELQINTGDLSLSECRELKEAGVDCAYHACRLGESLDNSLELRDRYQTIRNYIAAGISVDSGVEPIGPEHSPKEILDIYWEAYEAGCRSCSASARIGVPGTRLYSRGEVSPLRLEQIRSALVMGSTWCDRNPSGFYGGYYGGFNTALTEYSNSPKDANEISEESMGHTIEWGVNMLRSKGYRFLRTSDGGRCGFDVLRHIEK